MVAHDILPIILSAITVVATAISTFVVGRYRAMTANLMVITQANEDLRHQVEFERNERVRDTVECQKQTAILQAKVDVLITNIGEVIATAVLRTLEVQNALHPPKEH